MDTDDLGIDSTVIPIQARIMNTATLRALRETAEAMQAPKPPPVTAEDMAVRSHRLFGDGEYAECPPENGTVYAWDNTVRMWVA